MTDLLKLTSLCQNLECEYILNALMKDYTTFQIGGPCDILVRPYVTIGSTTYYGAAKEQSLYNAAKACEDTDNPIVKDILSAGDSNT